MNIIIFILCCVIVSTYIVSDAENYTNKVISKMYGISVKEYSKKYPSSLYEKIFFIVLSTVFVSVAAVVVFFVSGNINLLLK